MAEPLEIPFNVDACRSLFPGLSRTVGEKPAVFFDGPAGSQVPASVAEAVAEYLTDFNANTGGFFPTSVRSEELLRRSRETFARFLGVSDPECVVFGPNMTSLTLQMARALSEGWGPGDEVVLTRQEHDANFTPWVRAANESGATLRYVGVREDCSIELDELESVLGDRTRLVALGCASNAVGTIQPFAKVAAMTRSLGALLYLDAVHYAPHALMDVDAWGADLVVCSAYKFFGPHVGVLWARRDLLETLPSPRLRPVADRTPGRWMHGTPNHEGIVGGAAAVDYLAGLGRTDDSAVDDRTALVAAFGAIRRHEEELASRMLRGLAAIPQIRVWGVADPAHVSERVPTFGFTHESRSPAEIARRLADRGIFVWNGNFYAIPLTEALGLEPDGMVRVGMLHYNTEEEVDRLLNELEAPGLKSAVARSSE